MIGTLNPSTDLPQVYFDWVESGCLFLHIWKELAFPGEPRGNRIREQGVRMSWSMPDYRS